MKTTQLKNIALSTEMMDANQISSFVRDWSDTDLNFISIHPVQNAIVTKQLYKDYTAVQLYATDAVIKAGTVDPDTGLEYKVDVPASMTQKFHFKSKALDKAHSDIIINWGDGNTTVFKDSSDVTETKKTDEYHFDVTHTYTAPGKYDCKIYGNSYFQIRSSRDSTNLISKMWCRDYPIASNLVAVNNLMENNLRIQSISTGDYFKTNLKSLYWLFHECKNLLTVSIYPGAFSEHIINMDEAFGGCSNLKTSDYRVPANCDDVTNMYINCESLTGDVLNLLPKSGFAGSIIGGNAFSALFKGSKLSCSNYPKLDSLLFNSCQYTPYYGTQTVNGIGKMFGSFVVDSSDISKATFDVEVTGVAALPDPTTLGDEKLGTVYYTTGDKKIYILKKVNRVKTFVDTGLKEGGAYVNHSYDDTFYQVGFYLQINTVVSEPRLMVIGTNSIGNSNMFMNCPNIVVTEVPFSYGGDYVSKTGPRRIAK